MNINLEIINEEDIHYLNELPEDKRNNILKTAIKRYSFVIYTNV